MNELTLESLAKRVEALEAVVLANKTGVALPESNGPSGVPSHFDSDFTNATDRVFNQHEEILRRLA